MPPPPQKYLFIVRADTNLFLLILFSKILHIFLIIIIIIRCSGMFRNVPGCSMFRILSTAHDSFLQRYSIMFRSDKHSLKDDFSFQLDIGDYEQINARSKMCFDDQ